MTGISQALVDQTMSSGYFWDCYSRIANLERSNPTLLNNTLFGVYRLSLLIGFMLSAFQIGISVYRSYLNKRSPLADLIPYLFRLVVVTVLISPPVYKMLVHLVIAVPADSVADMVTASYIDRFTADMVQLQGALSNSQTQLSSFLAALVDGSLVSSLLSAFIFVAASICIFIMPILQSVLFLYFFFVGPVCLVFSLSDLTASVATAWLSVMLAVAWTGFFGSLCFLAAQSFGVLHSLAGGATGNDVIITMIYGVLSIIIFCMAFPLSSFFFGGATSIGRILNPTSAVSGAVTGAAAGLAMGGAATMAYGKLVGGAGHLLNKESLQKHGQKSFNAGAAVFNAAQNNQGPRTHSNDSSKTSTPSETSGGYSPTLPRDEK